MKKQFFRILSCCVLLACLCALPAYACLLYTSDAADEL